jgi:hypothetical protein
MLASSLSDGIGMEGVESGDIEMGGIAVSGGLANQDGQDGQDSREDVGSIVGGRMTIQGAGTSPRRTRSGKIVKYNDE